MRGSQVIESARLHKMGFPEIMSNVEFVRRFGLLLMGDSAATANETTVEGILCHNDIDVASFRVGPSQVSAAFCFYGFLAHKTDYCPRSAQNQRGR